MIRRSPPHCRPRNWNRIQLAACIAFLFLVAGCGLLPQTKVAKVAAPATDAPAMQQRAERAKANLSEGLKKYDSGNNDEAIKNFLLALDSGQLAPADQVNARKHIAFIHCLSGREANCKEEFEKIIALDPKFDLSPAEAGHPSWGPIHRVVQMEMERRRSGKPFPSLAVKSFPLGEKLIANAMQAYDDADYNKAIKSFQDALKETLNNTDRITAHKFIAFSYCLTNRAAQCRVEFESIFRLNGNFELAPAEAGHPSWGPSFRVAKAKQKSTPPPK